MEAPTLEYGTIVGSDIAMNSNSLSQRSILSSKSQRNNAFEELFDTNEELGSGAQGSVFRCTSKEDGCSFAVKIICTNGFVPKMMAMLKNEVQVLNQINGDAHILSPRIVQVFHAYQIPDDHEIPDCTYILMEHMLGGTLTEWRNQRESCFVSESETKLICRSLFEALDYCHQRGIAHRDIKPGNLLLAKPNDLTSLKIADFGFAKVVPQRGLTTRCGTPLFMPPEIVLLGSALYKSYETKCDMWSAGVVVYILLGGKPPFSFTTNKPKGLHDLFMNIVFNTVDLNDSHWGMVSNEAKTLIKGLMARHPHTRWSVKDVLECTWMNSTDTSPPQTMLPPSSCGFKPLAFDERSCCGLPPLDDTRGPSEVIPARSFDLDDWEVPIVEAEMVIQGKDEFVFISRDEPVIQVQAQTQEQVDRRQGLTKTSLPVTTGQRVTQVFQLSLSARGLKKSSNFWQPSDTFAIVNVRGDNPDNKPTVIGHSNVAFNNLSPTWATVIFIEGYQPGDQCYFEVGVFDFDAKETGMSERELQLQDSYKTRALVTESLNRRFVKKEQFPHRAIGTAIFEVGEILASRDHGCHRCLPTGGEVYAQLEPCIEDTQNGKFVFRLRAFEIKIKHTLMFKNTFSPFFEIFRKRDRQTGATWIKVYQSNVVQNSVTPIWDQVQLDIRAVCNGDLNKAIKILVWDHRWLGEPHEIGALETTVQRLMDAKKSDDRLETVFFDLMNNGEVKGRCEVLNASIQYELSTPGQTLELPNEEGAPLVEASVLETPGFVVGKEINS